MDFLTAITKAHNAFVAMRGGASQDFAYSDAAIWARPKSWRGLQALAPDHDHPSFFQLIPSAKGGSAAYLPSIKELQEDWEVITPDQFYEEVLGAGRV